MKKLARRVLWILTALCILFASATAVYCVGDGEAANETQNTGDLTEISAKGYLTKAQEVGNTISVTIEWDSLLFEYKEEQKGTWNTEQHVYEGGWKEGWVAHNNVIAVLNHSDVAVDVGFNFASTVISDIEYKYCVQEVLNNVVTSTPLEEQTNGYSFINLDKGSNIDGEIITPQKEVALVVEGGTLPSGFSTNPESPSDVGTVTVYVNASAS